MFIFSFLMAYRRFSQKIQDKGENDSQMHVSLRFTNPSVLKHFMLFILFYYYF